MLKTLLIGSYTTPETAGIRRVEVDTDAGEIRLLENVPGIGNPIYFAVDAARSRLYAAQGASPEAGRGSDGLLPACRSSLARAASFDMGIESAKLTSRSRDVAIRAFSSGG